MTLLAVVTAACGGGSPPSSASAPPAGVSPARHVVLVTIDTLRADRVGAYGYAAATTPAIDALAAAGLRVGQAFATAPVTLTSHASLLTGLYPPAHGARHNGVAMAPGVPTLATLLKAQGFATGAFVGAFPLERRFGLAAGFDVYGDRLPRLENGKPADERPGEDVVDEALAWRTTTGAARTFLWVHLFEPHAPYRNPTDGRPVAVRYDEEVAEADRQVGRLLDGLGAERASTLVVVTADHGEAFGEHGDFVHGHLAYEEVMHVPLLVKFPAGMAVAGGAVDALAQLTDIAPTVLDALGLGHLAAEMQGVSLLPAARSDAAGHGQPRRYAFAETQASTANHRLLAVRSERWKYLRIDPPGDYSGHAAAPGPAGGRQRLAGYWQQLANPEMVKRLLRNPMFYLRRQMAQRQMLFDLAADPQERVNVIGQHPAAAAELDAALEAWLADCRSYAELSDRQGIAGLDEATLAQLHGLGYL